MGSHVKIQAMQEVKLVSSCFTSLQHLESGRTFSFVPHLVAFAERTNMEIIYDEVKIEEKSWDPPPVMSGHSYKKKQTHTKYTDCEIL